jgi:polyhydroxyalkanoate synthesis regulator phasin
MPDAFGAEVAGRDHAGPAGRRNEPMLDTVRKMLLAGLGTLELTEEKLEGALRDLIKRGELTEQEARSLGEEWKQRLASRRDELQREARAAVQRALQSLDVASRQELEALTKRVEALEGRAPATQGATHSDLDREC